jgi:hypothetical protein
MRIITRRDTGLLTQWTFGSLSLDADAVAFLTAAGITDTTQQVAINTLVVDLKNYSLWTKCNAIYPMVGGTATTCKFNLKNPLDTDGAFRLNFQGGWSFSSTGATTNGTNTYADTFLTPNTSLTLLNTHLSFYSRTSAIGNNQRDLAAFTNGATPSFSLGTNTGVLISDHYWLTTNRMSRSIPNAQGMMLTSRTSDTVHKAYRNGTQLGATDTVSNAGNVMPSISLYLGAANQNPGTPTGAFSNKEYAFASIGSGLTDTEAANFYTAVQTFNTTLSRNV